MLTPVMATLKPWVCVGLLGCNGHRGVRVVPVGNLDAKGSEDISGLCPQGYVWLTSSRPPKKWKYTTWHTVPFMKLLFNFDGFHPCFCTENTHGRPGLKGTHRTNHTCTRNAILISQIPYAQQEALLVQDYKYSKKHFPDFHLGILIMDKCP